MLLFLGASPGFAQTIEQRVCRFLHQATFGPTKSEIDALTADATAIKNATPSLTDLEAVKQACESWIDVQQSAPFTATRAFLGQMPNYHGISSAEFDVNFNGISNRGTFDRALMTRMIKANDQLRHRVALALSEVFVISMTGPGVLSTNPLAMADYYDTLYVGGIGSFNVLLQNVSLHPLMGEYLSHRNNVKATATTHPDENYAREVMQLFSCGLYHLNDYGQILNSNGLVAATEAEYAPTYSNEEITEMARVFTGLILDPNVTIADDGRAYTDTTTIINNLKWTVPMVGNPTANNNYASHDQGSKTLLKLTPTGNPITIGYVATGTPDPVVNEVRRVCNQVLAAHASTPPFIATQLIKRLVTSNPSNAYVHRVVQVWKDSDPGTNVVRGNLKAVVKAILTDDEAMAWPTDTGNGLPATANRGKLREPSLVATNIQRVFAAAPLNNVTVGANTHPAFNDGNRWTSLAIDVGLPAAERPKYNLGQEFFNSPSVFNFFSPSFSPSGELRDNGLVGPEFQILTESSMLSEFNHYFRRAARFPLTSSVRSKYTVRFDPDAPSIPRAGSDATSNYSVGDPAYNQVALNFTEWEAFASSSTSGVAAVFETGEANAFLAELNLRLCYGMLAASTRDIIRNGTLMHNPTDYVNYTLQQRIRDAIFMVLSTPEYRVQR